jgi:hypothetical protein
VAFARTISDLGVQLLAELNSDCEYRRFVDEGISFGRVRGLEVEHALRVRSQPRMLKFGGALCLRGSNARRDCTLSSDIDIVHIADNVSYELCNKMLSDLDLVLSSQQRISIQSYHVFPTVHEQRSLVVWLSLIHLKYVAGTYQCYVRFMNNAGQILRKLSLDDFLRIYRSDPLRQDISSEHLGSFTRGYGSIVDYEFVELLATWQRLRNIELTETQMNVRFEITGFYRYLVTYKYVVSTVPEVRERYWFVSDEVCTQIRLALHTKLDLYVSLTLERNNTDT